MKQKKKQMKLLKKKEIPGKVYLKEKKKKNNGLTKGSPKDSVFSFH